MAAPVQAGSAEPAPRQARDAMAFGQESGRALSDGRIVGRAEPFAKVFPSSRTVKRAVGPVAWAVLEDIALEARIDDAGRLVSETNVRQIAENLALNKNTVNSHLARLRDYGFVLREEAREAESGRWEPCRYVLDPSACVERFTTTPSSQPRAETSSTAPCPNFSDTASGPVSEHAGHGELGHPIERHGDVEEQHAARADAGPREATAEPDDRLQAVGDRWDLAAVVAAAGDADADADGFHVAGDGCGDAEPTPDGRAAAASDGDYAAAGDDAGLYARLTAVGVARHVAEDLVARYPRQRIEDALAVVAAQPLRKPAGWIVTALRQQWDLTDRLAQLRTPQAGAQASRWERVEATRQREQAERAEETDADERRARGWSQAVSAALDDDQLAQAMDAVIGSVPVEGSCRLLVAEGALVAWAATAAQRSPDRALAGALAIALDQGLDPPDEVTERESLPDPPTVDEPPGRGLRQRLGELFDQAPLESTGKGARS